jgi:hypothetical protein
LGTFIDRVSSLTVFIVGARWRNPTSRKLTILSI